jgi:Mg2+ and Co2+ transporter CorA
MKKEKTITELIDEILKRNASIVRKIEDKVRKEEDDERNGRNV